MRDVSPDLQAHIDRDVTTLCWCWRLTLADDTQLGFTDHDEDIEIDGLTFKAETGLSSGETDSRLGYALDTGSVQGLLSSDRITPEDISSGRFDKARLESLRVNWTSPEQRLPVARGRLGEIRQRGEAFEAEWVGEGGVLGRSIGRVFTRLCDAELGDARCGLDLGDFPEGTTCPRTFQACRDRFSNTENFRGFPYLLGDDVLQSAPQEGEVFDGSSRYT